MTFGLLFSYIQSLVTDTNCPEYLASIHGQYCQFIDRIASDVNVEVVHSVPRTVNKKILNTFGDKVRLEMKNRKQGLVLCRSKMSKDEVL